MKVKCGYCGKETRFGDVEIHLKKCKHTLLPCPNECEDEETREVKQIERMNLDNHIENECPKRAYDCELCEEKGTFQHITQVHVQTCANVVVDCRNVQCNRRLQRRLLDEHVVNECEYTKVLCELCGIYVEKKNLDVHKQSDIHTLYDKEATATAERDELKQQAARATADRAELKQQAATATAERAELKQQAATATADRAELKQQAAAATANGIELRRQVYWLLIITGVFCIVVLMAAALSSSKSPPNGSHTSSIQSLKDSLATLEKQVAELKKQLAEKEKASEMAEKVAVLEKQLTAMKKGSPEMKKVDEKVAALEKQYAERNAELEKKLATNLKDDATLYNYDLLQKTINKKMEDFYLQQREDFIPVCISKKGTSISDPIAFGQNEFRIEISLFVYIKLLASVNKHFTGRATIVLLNQLEDKNHCFIKTVTFNEAKTGTQIRLGNITEIVHSSNPNIRYINDGDTICFKVLVEEASGAKPWLSRASNTQSDTCSDTHSNTNSALYGMTIAMFIICALSVLKSTTHRHRMY